MPGLADQNVPSGLPVPQVRQLPDPEHSSEQSWRDVCRNSVFMLKACHWCIGGIAISSLDTQHPEKNKKLKKCEKLKWIRELTYYILSFLPAPRHKIFQHLSGMNIGLGMQVSWPFFLSGEVSWHVFLSGEAGWQLSTGIAKLICQMQFAMRKNDKNNLIIILGVIIWFKKCIQLYTPRKVSH